MLTKILSILQLLPKVFEYLDEIIGWVRKLQEKRKVVSLEKLQADRRTIARQLKKQVTDKERHKLVRQLKRLGG